VNQSKEEEYESIALTVLALKQQGLLNFLTGNQDSIHLSISTESKFVNILAKRLSQKYIFHRDGESTLRIWRDLHVLDVVASRSPHLLPGAHVLLLDIFHCDNANLSLIGIILSLFSWDGSFGNWRRLISLIETHGDRLRRDLSFLEGLEKLLTADRWFVLFVLC
jgi:hypothetical protein